MCLTPAAMTTAEQQMLFFMKANCMEVLEVWLLLEVRKIRTDLLFFVFESIGYR